MNLREVTIGRSPNCDIYLDPRCQYASSMHATIYCEGDQLMYRDMSTNGTIVNGRRVHKKAVPIRRGDVIMLAGQYQLNWNQIDAYFPPTAMQRQATVPYAAPMPQVQQPASSHYAAREVVPASSYATTPATGQPSILGKWNWGAFFLNGIWGFFNGCWWIFLINLGISLFSWLLALIPFVGYFTPIFSIGWAIACGIKGNDWAWKNRTWTSVQDFEHTQHQWAKAALIVFCVSLGISIITGIVMAATMTAFLNSLAYGFH